jgi:excinuclease UvrABC ATPase subunit
VVTVSPGVAPATGAKPARGSANAAGVCPTGVIDPSLGLLAGVATAGAEGGRKRFQAAVLTELRGGTDISEVLAISVTVAPPIFGSGPGQTPADAILERLTKVRLDRLVDAGKSVIVIEHHQAVMAHADWIIDLGPGAGHDGGWIVLAGTPVALVAAMATLTGEHLAQYVGA